MSSRSGDRRLRLQTAIRLLTFYLFPQTAYNRVLKAAYKAPCGGQTRCCFQKRRVITVNTFFCPLRWQYCTSRCRNGVIAPVLMTMAANSQTKILNVPLILAPCQIWALYQVRNIPYAAKNQTPGNYIFIADSIDL